MDEASAPGTKHFWLVTAVYLFFVWLFVEFLQLGLEWVELLVFAGAMWFGSLAVFLGPASVAGFLFGEDVAARPSTWYAVSLYGMLVAALLIKDNRREIDGIATCVTNQEWLDDGSLEGGLNAAIDRGEVGDEKAAEEWLRARGFDPSGRPFDVVKWCNRNRDRGPIDDSPKEI